jgi:oligopeptide/dipeptide ABC transporter ATP-binding protein
MFDGVDLLALPKDQMTDIRGDKIAMIFQEPLTSLDPVLTIGRQITEALERHKGLHGREAMEEAIKLLKMVGIPQPDQRVKDYPHQFSGGMRQRAMIALAISCDPQLILADEPTTVVDVTIQAQLLELIRNITKELNTALILITHNLGIVARYAQRVYVMYAGHIVEYGPIDEIYHQAAHPYTKGLLASVPRLDEPRKTRLHPIDGQPPDLINIPAGCAFRPRCASAMDICATKSPGLVKINDAHYAACHLVKEAGN